MKFVIASVVLLFFLISPQLSVSQVTDTQAGAQEFEGEIMVDAPPEKVWDILVDLKNFSGVMGFKWQSGKDKVANVGDTARMRVWSDNTTYLLTFVEPGKEKDDVVLYDIYTESGGQSEEALQQQIDAWQGHLEKLKSMAES